MPTEIKDSDSVFITGAMGSGKSVCAETYLSGLVANDDRIVLKLDTKDETSERWMMGEPIFKGHIEDVDVITTEHLTEIEKFDKEGWKYIIYRPDFQEQTLEVYDQFFEWVYKRKNIVVWVDELMSICPSATRYPPWLKAIMTRGRSRRTTIWALTQRPVDIPVIIGSNCKHYFVYLLNQPGDRKKMAELTGCSEMLDIVPPYYFHYYCAGSLTCTYATLAFNN